MIFMEINENNRRGNDDFMNMCGQAADLFFGQETGISESAKRSDSSKEPNMEMAKKIFDQEMSTFDEDKINEAAKFLYSFYSGLMKAGFSKDQAYNITTISMVTILNGATSKK